MIEKSTVASISYDGSTRQILSITIKNLLLNIATFFLYHYWAKANVRKYVYGNIAIFGDRLEYTGSGGELFQGYLKAAIYLLIIYLLYLVFSFSAELFPSQYVISIKILLYAILGLFIVFTLAFARFYSYRYRFSRILWRGVKGKLIGKAMKYASLRMERLFINIFTLGYCIGRSDLMLRKHVVVRSYLGNKRFSFDVDVRALDRVNLVTLLLFIPTLGLSRLIYYRAALIRLKWEGTSIENAKFVCKIDSLSLSFLYLKIVVVFILTLGLGMPIAVHMMANYFGRKVSIEGGDEGLLAHHINSNSEAVGEGFEDIMNDDGLYVDFGIW